jgi:hypothetical protein
VLALLLFVSPHAIGPQLWQNSMNKGRLEALLQKTFSRFLLKFCPVFLTLKNPLSASAKPRVLR